MFTQPVITVLLLVIFYQDIKSRAVNWIIFPVLTAFFSLFSLEKKMIDLFLIDVVANLSFVMLQLGLLSVYFWAKEKQIIIITQNRIGWGDILFLATISFYFSPANYILFYVASLLFTICFVVAGKRFNDQAGIPLAGIQAALICAVVNIDVERYATTDTWIFKLL